ncbi:MAG: hypothetical protein P1U63_03510 [Coxiellaceae bacterium]|nr:hypothetical protein [Coxiellaceae bacterium]
MSRTDLYSRAQQRHRAKHEERGEEYLGRYRAGSADFAKYSALTGLLLAGFVATIIASACSKSEKVKADIAVVIIWCGFLGTLSAAWCALGPFPYWRESRANYKRWKDEGYTPLVTLGRINGNLLHEDDYYFILDDLMRGNSSTRAVPDIDRDVVDGNGDNELAIYVPPNIV